MITCIGTKLIETKRLMLSVLEQNLLKQKG
ncbi:MAG: hypothetical protein K0R54_6119 [Clostridiaceae bacterium]|nr:hypothetical protein [Clostridiaceae bacterium]